MNESKPNPLDVALLQLKTAAEHLNLDLGIHEVLKHPKRALIVSLPVKMDDGRVNVFLGCRVQHNDARGPFKGGVRYHPDVTLDEVSALAISPTFRGSGGLILFSLIKFIYEIKAVCSLTEPGLRHCGALKNT